jgi:hypothetical protein
MATDLKAATGITEMLRGWRDDHADGPDPELLKLVYDELRDALIAIFSASAPGTPFKPPHLSTRPISN